MGADVVDAVGDGEDGCGGRVLRVVAIVGVVVRAAVVDTVDDAVSASAVGESVASLTTAGDCCGGSDDGASVGLLDNDYDDDVVMAVDLVAVMVVDWALVGIAERAADTAGAGHELRWSGT